MLPIFTILPWAAISSAENSLHKSMTLNRLVIKIDSMSSRLRSIAGTERSAKRFRQFQYWPWQAKQRAHIPLDDRQSSTISHLFQDSREDARIIDKNIQLSSRQGMNLFFCSRDCGCICHVQQNCVHPKRLQVCKSLHPPCGGNDTKA